MERVKISQRARLLALLLGILILGVLGQSFLINAYLLGNFKRLEENQVRSSARLINLWLDNFLQPLDELARMADGWASSRTATAGADWAAQVLAAAQQREIAFDAAALVAADGTVLKGFAVDAALRTAAPLPPATAKLMQRHARESRANGGLSGWMATEGGLFASASRAAGSAYVVLGRHFSNNDLLALEELSNTRISLTRAGADPGLQTAGTVGELKSGGEGNRPMQLCSVLTPALNPGGELLCLQLQDSIYLRGKASVDDLRLATLSGFVLLILSAWLFLDRALLKRLQTLVGELTAARDADTRPLQTALLQDSARQDELAQLTGGMSRLLQQVRDSEIDLRRQQANFKNLAESTGVAILVESGLILYANPYAEMLTGYTREELHAQGIGQLLHRNDRERVESRLREALAGQATAYEPFEEVRGQRKDGSHYWARLRTATLAYQDRTAVLVTLFDTSEQRHLEAVLAREKERLQVILGSIEEGIISVDSTGKVIYLNTAAERLIGYESGSALGKPLALLVRLTDPKTNRVLQPPDGAHAAGAVLAANLMTPFGDHRQIEIRVSRLQWGEAGRPGAVLVLRDVSELRRMTRNLEYQAAHDELTGLVNRREFNHRLQEALETCRRTGEPHVVCYMDLDQFKTVNDICGHHAGDLLLQQITAALRDRVRAPDTLARLGGDEFGLLLARCTAEQAVAYADELRGIVSDVRFTWGGRTFTVDASVGVLLLNHIEGGVDEALSIADTACYIAKEQGRNRVRLSRPGDVDLQRQFGQMRWAQRLKDALERGHFRLFRQGVHRLVAHPGEPPACEVLLRLRETESHFISAGEFLDAAERYQMMPNIDRWVVEGVLEHMRGERVPRHYFVNLSGQSLGDEGFHAFLLEALGVAPELSARLTFEVTETAVISNLSRAQRFMQQLRERGTNFALDDFGTGMSTFVYLKELQVQYLKIAGPFVKNMGSSPLDEAIVRNFATFARQMGLLTIAEWVEDDHTVALLRGMGVDYGQGFVLDQPVPLEAPPAEAAIPAATGT